MRRTGAWVDVYPFNEKTLLVQNTGARVSLGKELSDHCSELWAPKAAKHWANSWVAFMQGLHFSERIIHAEMGAMPFSFVSGIDDAMMKGKFFAPEQGYVNSLSVGFLTATSDEMIILQRRPEDVNCPNILIHEPCGYMATMYVVPRAECDDPKHADNWKLFNLKEQLDYRKREVAATFGLPPEAVEYEPQQDLLACGWSSWEMYFSTTGRMNAKSTDLKLPANQEIFFVPFEYLRELINNQGKLSKVNPIGYRPSDPRDIPLIDESLVGLIWGYKKLTGEKLDLGETIDRLNQTGLDIKVHDTSPRTSYTFPTSF